MVLIMLYIHYHSLPIHPCVFFLLDYVSFLVSRNVKNDLEIIPVTTVSEVLQVALSEKLQSIEWDFAEYENSDKLKGKQSGEVELPN